MRVELDLCDVPSKVAEDVHSVLDNGSHSFSHNCGVCYLYSFQLPYPAHDASHACKTRLLFLLLFCLSCQVAEMLLARGATVNVADQHGNTPLHRAASKGNTTLVKLLLSYHANPNARDGTGSTPLLVFPQFVTIVRLPA